jgi:hypothetical protein
MSEPLPKAPTRHEMDRLMVGNQIAIMRALSTSAAVGPLQRRDLDLRIGDIKSWWRLHFNEEVGFSAALGDRPPEGG